MREVNLIDTESQLKLDTLRLSLNINKPIEIESHSHLAIDTESQHHTSPPAPERIIANLARIPECACNPCRTMLAARAVPLLSGMELGRTRPDRDQTRPGPDRDQIGPDLARISRILEILLAYKTSGF